MKYSFDGLGTPSAEMVVYPYGGLPISMTPDKFPLRQIQIRNSISRPSTFQVMLAPTSLLGTDTDITLPKLIPVRSLVLIYLGRGEHKYLAFIGLVTSIQEDQHWRSRAAERRILIEGMDFTYFLSTFSYYTLTWLGSLADLNVISSYKDIVSSMSTASLSPQDAGKKFYEQVFTPYLKLSQFWNNNSFITVPDILESRFGGYRSNSDLYIPLLLSFLSSDGNWMQKFSQIFPHPLYETFVMTYEDKDAKNYPSTSSTGESFTLAGNTAKTGFIAREMPIPSLYIPGTDESQVTVDMDLWDALNEYEIEDSRFIQSTVSNSIGNVRNLYKLDPYMLKAMLPGKGAQAVVSLLEAVKGIGANLNSINRYGIMPEVFTTIWFSDDHKQTNSKNPKVTQDSIQALAWAVLYKLQSYYGPTPQLFNASVETPLAPDILPGNKFTYAPFKGGDPWTFYIEECIHTITFGGPSRTSFVLSRGLPKSSFSDTSFMTDLLLGNIIRKEGGYSYVSADERQTSFRTIGIDNLLKFFNESLPMFRQAQGGK